MADFNLLGLGSNDMLNSNLINQMREQDIKMQINPISKKLDTLDVKFERLYGLRDQVAALDGVISTLGSELTYLEVNTFTTNSGIAWVNSESGVKPQTFTLDVQQKARADMYQSNKVVGVDAALNTVPETITYTVAGGVQKTIDIPANATLQEVSALINDTGDMTASILKVSDTEFRLSVKGKDEGASNALVFTGVGPELDAVLGLSDPLNHTQAAQNAQFSYNGVAMERGTNVVTDIIYGVSIELADIGSTEVVIEPNYENIVTNIQGLVDVYNQTVEMVKANTSGEEEGDALFRTNREVSGIMREINKILFEVDYFNNDNPLKSIVDVGFTKNKDGTISFDDSKIEDIMINNFSDITDLFSKSEKGIFSRLMDTMDSMTNIQRKGSLDELDKTLTKEGERLNEKLDRTQARLDVQYQMMEQRFAAFDALMGRMNSAFSSLKLQIDQSVSKTEQ